MDARRGLSEPRPLTQYLLEKLALMRWRRYSAPVMGGYFLAGPSMTASSLAWQKKARL
ncbi:hypothetical protein D3C87_2159480 [compost metagenome]